MHLLRMLDVLRPRYRRTGSVLTAAFGLCLAPTIPSPAQTATSPADGNPLAAARRAVDTGDWGTAERILRQPAAATSQTPEAHYLLGYVLFREQRATESLAEYTAAARLRPPTADDLIVVASDYILLKAYPDAERWLLYATHESPANAMAWYLLGRTQYNLDHPADAVASFQKRLELSPRDVRAEYNLGLALEKINRPADAEAAYRTAIAWQQEAPARDPQPYLDLGMLLLGQRHADQALPVLREATVLGPRNALAHQELGLTLEALSQDAEAVVALKQAAKLAPNAEQPHFFLGRVYRRLGKSAEAAAEFAEVQRLAGGRSEKETPNDAQPMQ